MASPSTICSALCLLAATQLATAQQAITPADQLIGFGQLPSVAVNPYGMLLAQNTAAIEQARLYQRMKPQIRATVDANGNALPESTDVEDDDSFGAQRFLKTQERPTTFVVTGGASLVYTDNVALTRRAKIDDVFAVVDAGISWLPRIGRNLEPFVALRASIFRYDKTADLDFQNLGFGTGIAWAPAKLRGVSVFARYDFTQLFDADGDDILTDHALTVGLQKSVALGRSHGFTFGASGTLGISDPETAQRSQIGAFLGYRLQLTRKIETEFLYRPAVHFYTDSGRADLNQILSWNMRYRFNEWAELNATISYGVNRSEHSAFDYNVLTTGAGVGVSIRF